MMEELKLIQPGEVRVRIAPAPTGPIHIGTARTALFNYLFAKKYQGAFILRIEDTDKQRSNKEYEDEIIKGFKWLGIQYEGPYRQSERKQIYRKYIEKLLNKGVLYYCFCTAEELEDQKQYLMSIGKPAIYSGKCKELSKEQVDNNISKGKPYILRFKVPHKKVLFNDLLRGEIEYDASLYGDIAVARDEETPLYNLACVIDDHEMKITHIIRGEDHIPNTPKQILLAEALDISVPKYLHLALILGPDRAKLSKRHGAKSLMEYVEDGYLPESMINFLVLLGWNPGTNREIFSMASLIQEFSAEGIQKSGASFASHKLDWINGFYIRAKSEEKLAELCIPYLNLKQSNSNYVTKEKEKFTFIQIKSIISLYQERLKKLSEIYELTDYFFKKQIEYNKELLVWKDMEIKDVKNNLGKTKKALNKIKEKDWNQTNIQNTMFKLIEDMKQEDRGTVLWPLRACLTGKQASAGPFEVAELMGKKKTMDRIKHGISIIGDK